MSYEIIIVSDNVKQHILPQVCTKLVIPFDTYDHNGV